jgi:hypothetical protein
MFYKFDFLVLKFKSSLLKSNFSLFKLNGFFNFKNHKNDLTQISLIDTTLKWHYINIFEKIDSFSIVQHGLCFIWLWYHPQMWFHHFPYLDE